MRYVAPSPTPIWDRLMAFTNGDALATYNAERCSGGEWDTLARTPLRIRRSLTGARLMRLGGVPPDVFADMLRRHVGSECGPDPIAWYIREARKAIAERRTAAERDARRRLAVRNGLTTYYEWRHQQAIEAGFSSFWAYRKDRRWT